MKITRIAVNVATSLAILSLGYIGTGLILMGLDDRGRSTVRGVTGEWRASVAMGAILLAGASMPLFFIFRRARMRKPNKS